MKTIKRCFALLLCLILLLGAYPFGVLAASEDAGQEDIFMPVAGSEETAAEPEPSLGTVIDPDTGIEYEILSSVEDIIPEEDFSEDTGGVIELNDTTTIEYEPAAEDDRAEVIAAVMEEIAAEGLSPEDENSLPAPDDELLSSVEEAVLRIDFGGEGCAVAVETDNGAEQTAALYYLSEDDGQPYSLAPDDLALEMPVETDDDGLAVVPIRRGASVRLSVIGGYGYEIAGAVITDGDGSRDIAGGSYEFTMTGDAVLSIAAEEVGVETPDDEHEVEGIQVQERNGVMLNDPTVTLPAEDTTDETSTGVRGPRKISGSYWGTVSGRYEGGGTHPYPNGNSTGVFTVSYGSKYYTGVCIDPSLIAPGAGYVNQWRTWNYYNVTLKDNPTFFAALAASYYSNFGSTSGTVAYINLRDRTNWSAVGGSLYSLCDWGSVVDNPSYGHGFAMYHELLGYLANGWTWDRSVLGSSGIKSYIVNTCNALYKYCNPSGSSFRQSFYNVLYTYRCFYYQSTTSGRQRIAWTVPRTDYGSVTITKTSAKTGEPLAGCTVTLTDINDPNHKFTGTTGADGKVTFDYVVWTTYRLEEVKAPEGYELSYVAENVAFTASARAKTISDQPEGGDLKIVKTSDDGNVGGITFTVKNNDTGETQTAVTGNSGEILLERLAPGSYTVTETVPTAYVTSQASKTVTITSGETSTVSFANTLKRFRVTFTKTDAATGSAQGDATLAGAVYGLYHSGREVARYTTDANGKFTTDYYACGTGWTIKEITPSTGYTLNTTTYAVGASPGSFTLASNTVEMTGKESVIMGQIAVTKTATNSVAGTETPENGATFEVYLKAAGSYDAAKDAERDILTTDNRGYAISKKLPYGVYILRQLTGWEGYLLDETAYEVIIGQDGQVVSLQLKNEIYKGTLRIVKQDEYTFEPLAGAMFQISNSDGFVVLEAATGADGTITAENLVYGSYTYHETNAPAHYRLDETVYDFSITEDGQLIEHTRDNLRIPGAIKVIKTDSAGRPLAGATYTLEYSTNGGRSWQTVYARDGDNVTEGGCTSPGLRNGSIATGADGIAEFTGLRADTAILYRLTETAAPNGYSLMKDAVYTGTLPVDGAQDVLYEIALTVREGIVTGLPMTGSRSFALLPLAVCLAAASMGLVLVTLRRRRPGRHTAN